MNGLGCYFECSSLLPVAIDDRRLMEFVRFVVVTSSARVFSLTQSNERNFKLQLDRNRRFIIYFFPRSIYETRHGNVGQCEKNPQRMTSKTRISSSAQKKTNNCTLLCTSLYVPSPPAHCVRLLFWLFRV